MLFWPFFFKKKGQNLALVEENAFSRLLFFQKRNRGTLRVVSQEILELKEAQRKTTRSEVKFPDHGV